MKVGFIGLGVMGAYMATHLAKIYELSVYDIDPKKTGNFADGSVRIADSVQDAARNADVVLLSLPSSEAVRDVLIGPDGISPDMTPGTTVIDMSTTAPELSREVAKHFADLEIGFLDAPVSGGEAGAREASLAIMVGGAVEEFDRHKELLETIGGSVVLIGDVGSGGIAKLVNNMIVGAAFSVIAEGFALAREYGIELETLYDAIKNGWAGSKVLDVAAPGIVAENYEPGGTVNLLFKDIGYALELARSRNVPTPMTAQVDELFKEARFQGYGDKAQHILIKLWDKSGN